MQWAYLDHAPQLLRTELILELLLPQAERLGHVDRGGAVACEKRKQHFVRFRSDLCDWFVPSLSWQNGRLSSGTWRKKKTFPAPSSSPRFARRLRSHCSSFSCCACAIDASAPVHTYDQARRPLVSSYHIAIAINR
jgi:hypothetical protein